ncbi:hypothetical protein V6R21_30750 [Limibacter armeniacum]|uniref:hypothetical protein n=1 Tax=Limibacter armeniacum TaxID=466084 RepID=UPI002FE56D40
MNSVLLAESKAIDAAHMELMLKRLGWKTDIVNDETNLKAKLKAEQYSMIILDEATLGDELRETVKMIRDRENVTGVPVTIIGTTAYSLRGQLRKLLQIGMDFSLSKPIYNQDLVGILEAVAEKEEQRKEKHLVIAAS